MSWAEQIRHVLAWVGIYSILVTILNLFAESTGTPQVVYACVGAACLIYAGVNTLYTRAVLKTATARLDTVIATLIEDGHPVAPLTMHIYLLLMKLL